MSFSYLACLFTIHVLVIGSEGVEIGNLPNIQHGISGTFHILDSKRIYIEDFNYDGQGPDVYFYYYLPGQSVDRTGGGITIPAPSEYGQSDGRLKRSRFTNVDIEVTLPDGTDTCDIGTFTIWCQQFSVFFTRITVPRSTFEDEGSDPCRVMGESVVVPSQPVFDNCIPFHEKLQLSWRVNFTDSSVRFRICGCQSSDPSNNQYMGFGLSGSTTATQMFGADPTIAWVDETDGAQAVDYYLSAYTQCRDGVGACPDTEDSSELCTNDVMDVQGSVTDGQQCVSFTRTFNTSDAECDLTINPNNTDQYIVWAIGGLGETAFKHFERASIGDSPIHLARTPSNECENNKLVCDICDPFENEEIIVRESATFEVLVGPSGNERGYMGITGRAGWGISFFVNGTIIPNLVVERGQTYTFHIYGGNNPNDISNYHPLYITDSIGGGRLANTVEEQNRETVYAGFDDNMVTAVGDLCMLIETSNSENTRESCSNDLQAYLNTLEMSSSCATAQPGVLVWTPDDSTPDTVYYQCATHLNLGWSITVLDEGEVYPRDSARMFAAASLVTVLVSLLLSVGV